MGRNFFGVSYVLKDLNFDGLNCIQRWRKKQDEKQIKSTTEQEAPEAYTGLPSTRFFMRTIL